MPNIFALLVLYSWPLLVFFMYSRLPVQRAFIWSILLGYLFMPPASAAFDLPGLPEFSKLEIAAVSSALMAIAFHGTSIIKLPKNPIILLLIFAYVTAPVFTVLTNLEDMQLGRLVISGLNFIEIPALVINQAIFLIPFLMAYSLLSDFDHLTDVLMAFVIGLMAYSILILFEVRFSPQLNIWVYGFFQHSFAQMIRGDGFRPIVFLYHALWIGFFTVMGVVATVALYKNRQHSTSAPFLFAPETIFARFFRNDPRLVYLFMGLFFLFVLVVSKSMGPILFGFSLAAVLLFTRPKLQVVSAFVLTLLVLSYPLLREYEIFPTELLIGAAESASSDRGSSLAFRFFNEEILLERAVEKPWFGWGAGSRNLILDPLSGRLLSIPDGAWIITLGIYGAFGFIAEMGLILMPVFAAFYWRNVTDPKVISPYVPAFSLLLTANAVDMLPNATLTPLTMLLSGAIWRHLEGIPERLKIIARQNPAPLFGGTILPYDPASQDKRTIL